MVFVVCVFVCCLLFGVCWLLCAVCRLPFDTYCFLFGACCVYCALVDVCGCLLVVCCLLYIS